VPVDKTSHNLSIVCKHYYSSTTITELNCGAYAVPAESKVDILIRHAQWNSRHVFDHKNVLMYLYGVPKFHKFPPKFRFIAGVATDTPSVHPQQVLSGSCIQAIHARPPHQAICSTTMVSKLVSIQLKYVMEVLQIKDDELFMRKGIRRYWIISNMDTFFLDLKKYKHQLHGLRPRTFDFTKMYTCLEHEKIRKNLSIAVEEAIRFIEHCGGLNNAVNKVLPILEKGLLISYIEYIISNTYVCNEADTVRQQVIGIPMGTNCGPEIANLTLYVDESQFVDGLNIEEARKHSHTRRFIDDVIAFDTQPPSSEIYGLKWLETTNVDGSVNFLGSTIQMRVDGTFSTSVYDKFEEWPFTVIKYPHISSNVPIHQSSGIIKGQLFRFRIICNCISSFKVATTAMVSHMLLRGYDLKHIFKGWNSHLAKFCDDSFTHYPRLRMWFKKMLNWVVKAQKAGVLLATNHSRHTPMLFPPTSETQVLLSPHLETPLPRPPPSASMPVLHDSDTLSLDINDPGTLTLARNLAVLFETEYLTKTGNAPSMYSQVAVQNLLNTSLLYLHLVLYRDFFAVDELLHCVTTITRAMEKRWYKAKHEKTCLTVECMECHQHFPSVDSCSKHQSASSSNCVPVQRMYALAIAALQDQSGVQLHSPSIMEMTNELTSIDDGSTLVTVCGDISNMITTVHHEALNMEPRSLIIVHKIGNIQVSDRDMHSLIQEGELVEDNIIDAFQFIASTLNDRSYYFNLAFFQCLVDINGYSINNVKDWVSFDLFQMSFLYFPLAFNAHYILIVADMENKIIRCYDPLGINRRPLMFLILKYLSDMFDMIHGGDNETWDMEERGNYVLSWTIINVFTADSRIQFNAVDCGVFLMKTVHLLGQLGDITVLNQFGVSGYRKEMVMMIQLYDEL